MARNTGAETIKQGETQTVPGHSFKLYEMYRWYSSQVTSLLLEKEREKPATCFR